MTGSGKTGLVMVTMEEALRAGVPVLAIDVKGDLPNLLLAFPSLAAAPMVPFVAADAGDDRPAEVRAEELAKTRREGLASWGIDEAALARFSQSMHVRVITLGFERGGVVAPALVARATVGAVGRRSGVGARGAVGGGVVGAAADRARSRSSAEPGARAVVGAGGAAAGRG